jgi:thioredoxin 1
MAKKKYSIFILVFFLSSFPILLLLYQTSFSQSSTDRIPKEVAQIRLPKLLDFGVNKCIPCKKMAPILQELTEEYKGPVVIRVIEICQERELTRLNGIQLIPTQIFFNARNQEVYRHVGFMDKEQIKKVFNTMGVK